MKEEEELIEWPSKTGKTKLQIDTKSQMYYVSHGGNNALPTYYETKYQANLISWTAGIETPK